MELSVAGGIDRTVVAVNGNLDVATAGELRESLHHAIGDAGTSLIVDLTGVWFLDSTALGVLVGVHKRLLERGGGLQLVCPRDGLLRIFRLTGLDRVFAIHASLTAVPA
ncbi:STAS domain-containing protein [Dactylosporangium sp. NPDC005555]|uniref:STAS domain-containing protein n=1 Tax=Dactylosporangium sp. NPDC005555 TaxID=3154889 RepID=UPI0033B80644